MRDNVLWTFVISEMLFVAGGIVLVIFSLVTQSDIAGTQTATNVAQNLLFDRCPLTAGTINAVFVFVTFLMSLPALAMPMNRGWLKVHGYMVVFCALFTLILGLFIWFETLRTRSELLVLWTKLPAATQSLLQQEFKCCGYTNSATPPFVPDSVCPDAATAATLSGCVSPFSKYANNFLDLIFTGAFGIVGVDVALLLAVAMILKDRKEKERFRHIDEKAGNGAF